MSRVLYHFESDALPGAPWQVRSARIVEALDTPFSMELEAALPETPTSMPEVSVLLGRNCVLTLERGGRRRRVCGLVRRVREGDNDDQHVWTHLDVVPALWMLGLGRNSRIFEERTVPEIVETVLAGALRTYGRGVRLELSRIYPRREYCVQYQESDLEFVHRLLEEEGIAYSFDHEGDVEMLVLHDSNAAFRVLPAAADVGGVVPYEPHDLEVVDVEPVTSFQIVRRVAVRGVVLRDYDWTVPSRRIEVELREGEDHPDLFERLRDDVLLPGAQAGLEVAAAAIGGAVGVDVAGLAGLAAPDETPEPCESYEHGLARSLTVWSYQRPLERYVAHDGDGQKHIRLEAHRRRATVGEGVGRVIGFGPGLAFHLSGHPSIALDDDYRVTRVEHRCDARNESGDTYHNRFECLQADVAYRPERRTPKPFVASIQTATVVGPPGEEIHTDEHGRIRVRFHWDRRRAFGAHGTCWVRVQQTWSGPGWGSVFLPRIGMEVVVTFLDGDPDRPLVTGCVYNGDNRHPYALPAEKSKSTIKSRTTPGGDGYNELRFEDHAGSEEIWIHAQKDWNSVVLHDLTQRVDNDRSRVVGHDESVTVGHDQSVHVAHDGSRTIDNDETVGVGRDRSVAVARDSSSRTGRNRSLGVEGSYRASVTGNETRDVGGNLAQRVAGHRVEQTEGQHHTKAARRVIECVDEILLKVGDSFLSIQPDQIVLEAHNIFLNCDQAPGDASPPDTGEGEDEEDDEDGSDDGGDEG